MTPLVLHNTLTREKETFAPADGKTVRMYCCGPTVYNYAHIGNLRTYIFEDLLRRTLAFHGWGVQHVMNITDVGHMTSDADAGEDKMAKAAAREQKSPWELAKFYEDAFFRDSARLNILKPDDTPRATEHVYAMVMLIQRLQDNGYTYETSEGVYFDTAKNADYGKLARLNLAAQMEAARDDVVTDSGKRHPADFILWFNNKPNHIMQWDSAYGRGYPGWHIECSAMSMAYLGETLDIHCGGIDHIPVHNTNEIAQSECATGHPFARFWVHGAFLNVSTGAVTGRTAEKMAKSGDNFLTVDLLIDKGYEPLAYRYLCLTAHYRSELAFSWASLDGATKALGKVWELKSRIESGEIDDLTDADFAKARTEIADAISDDLNVPKAVGLLHEYKSYRLWREFDPILGLDMETRSRATLAAPGVDALPPEVAALAVERDAARKSRDWAASDALRAQIEGLGYTVGDFPHGHDGEEEPAMSAAAPRPIAIPEAAIADFCRRHHIRRLALFGSVLRDDFRPDSDIDVLIEFAPGHALGLAFFALEEELEQMLGRTVDLNTPGFLSRYFRDRVMSEAETLYEQGGTAHEQKNA